MGLTAGRLNVTFNGTGHFHQIWGGWPGGLRLGRDGAANPVDPTTYSRLSFQAYSPVATVSAVTYQTSPDVNAQCVGSVPFTFPSPGWHVVDVDLHAGTGLPYAGDVQALAITIGGDQPRAYAFDWMRLYRPTTPVSVTAPGTSLYPVRGCPGGREP